MSSVKTVAQFMSVTGLSRGARKKTVDKELKKLSITDDDLIADIYGSLGI